MSFPDQVPLLDRTHKNMQKARVFSSCFLLRTLSVTRRLRSSLLDLLLPDMLERQGAAAATSANAALTCNNHLGCRENLGKCCNACPQQVRYAKLQDRTQLWYLTVGDKKAIAHEVPAKFRSRSPSALSKQVKQSKTFYYAEGLSREAKAGTA